MINVLYVKSINPMMRFNITKKDDDLIFKIKKNNITYDATLKISENRGKVIFLGVGKIDIVSGSYVTLRYELYNFADRYSGYIDLCDYKERRLAEVSFEENGDVNICVYEPSFIITTDGINLIELSDEFNPNIGVLSFESFYTRCPIYKKAYIKRMIKSKMIKNVDYYDTISYLESTVDILTNILLETLPKDHKYRKVLETSNMLSVLADKDENKIIEELESDKGNVRRLQKMYKEDKEKYDRGEPIDYGV